MIHLSPELKKPWTKRATGDWLRNGRSPRLMSRQAKSDNLTMVLLPLGLNGRSPNRPLASLFVIIITTFYSLWQFEQVDRFEDFLVRRPELRQLILAKQKLGLEYCQAVLDVTQPHAEASCDLFQKTLTSSASHLDGKKFEQLLKNRLNLKSSDYETKKTAKILNHLHRLVSDPEKIQDEDVRQFASFHSYLEAAKALRQTENEFHKENSNLSKATVNITSTLRAQFLHGGWMHLIGNMLIFAAFAFALENRVGVPLFLLIYFVGGSAGMAVQAAWALPEGIPLLGASANVSAVAGAFIIFFWRHHLRVWFSLIFYNRIVLIPALIVFPFTILANDIIGVLGETNSNIGHVAHLVGFSTGALLASLISRFKPLPEFFMYHQELDWIKKSQGAANRDERNHLIEEVLSWNPENRKARLLNLHTIAESQSALEGSDLQFVRTHLSEALTQEYRKQNYSGLMGLIENIPPTWNLSLLLTALPQGLVIDVGNGLAKKEKTCLALRFFDVFLTHHGKTSYAPAVKRGALQLLNGLFQKAERSEQIQELERCLISQSLNSLKNEVANAIAMNAESNHERSA